jgi:hypothetical protein
MIRARKVWGGSRYLLAESIWSERCAHVISQAGSPVTLTLGGLYACAHSIGGRAAWTWSGIYALLVIAVPVAYLCWLVSRGEVSDLDVQRREQRSRPLLATLTGISLAWGLLWWKAAPALLLSVASAHWLQMLVVFIITLRWKISMHTAAAAAFVALMGYLVGSAAAPMVLSLPVIAWARIRLSRHTPAQTLAGAVLGSAVMLLML